MFDGINIILGEPGTGKTLFASMLAHNFHTHGTNVFSNWRLNFNHGTIRNTYDLEAVRYGVMFLDEAYSLLDSRKTGSNINFTTDDVIRRSRKRGYTVYLLTQLWRLIDIRMRDLANHLFLPRIPVRYSDKTSKFPKGSPQILQVSLYNRDKFGKWWYNGYLLNRFRVDDPALKLYNTREDIYKFEPDGSGYKRKKGRLSEVGMFKLLESIINPEKYFIVDQSETTKCPDIEIVEHTTSKIIGVEVVTVGKHNGMKTIPNLNKSDRESINYFAFYHKDLSYFLPIQKAPRSEIALHRAIARSLTIDELTFKLNG